MFRIGICSARCRMPLPQAPTSISKSAKAQLGAAEASRGIAPTWQACEGKLLWRARIMKEGWLMLTFHHAIVDEKSICMLMRLGCAKAAAQADE